MRRLLKNKLLNNAFIFTFSSILNKGINFLLLPVLTHYLTKDDYGHLGFIVSVVAISTIFVGLWPPNFIMAKFHLYDRQKLSKYMSNIFIITFITFFIVMTVMYLFKNTIFTNFQNPDKLIFLISLYTLFTVVFNIFNIITQLEKNAIRYAVFQFVYLFSSLSLALFLIVYCNYDWRGKFYSELFILSILTVYIFYYLKKSGYLSFDFDFVKIKKITSFLFPMTFSIVSLFMISTADKIILAKYLDIEAVGIYTIAMTMSIIINIIFDALISAWSPYFFEKIATKTKEDILFIKRSLLFYSLFVAIFTVIYIFVIPFVFHIMIDSKFDQSLNYIPFLVTGFAFEGLRKPLTGFLLHKNKTKVLAIASLVVAFLNIVLNIVLVQRYNIYGATYSTIFSFVSLYGITLYLVYRYCDIFKTNQPS